MEPGRAPTAVIGARPGHPSWLHHLVARATAKTLHAFVVPGAEVARASGLDLAGAGLRPVATPRHANVLVLIGQIPENLARAAAVVYAQMPRPRAILALGSERVPSLPEPDVAVPAEQTALVAGVTALRQRLAADSFRPEAPVFDAAALQTVTEYTCPMHPEVVRSAPGSCPTCGMELVPREATSGMTDHAAGSMQHSHREHDETATYTCPMHPEVVQHEPGSCPICGMTLEPRASDGGDPGAAANHDGSLEMDHEAAAHHHHGDEVHAGHPTGAAHHDQMTEMDHGATNHGATNHGGHEMGGFMSMVGMTKDLPRSPDGLPMEWIEVPFGPLFPSLPGGLALTLTLDGDRVAQTAVTPGIVSRGLAATWPGPLTTFPARLARLDPLTPVTYRLLAQQALEQTAGIAVPQLAIHSRISALERERAGSHLNWLAEFVRLLGVQRLADRAAALQLALRHVTEIKQIARLRAEVAALLHDLERTPLLRRRLRGIGIVPDDEAVVAGGPVARATGVVVDARNEELVYHGLGYRPIVQHGSDALARLQVRAGEISQSLDLILATGCLGASEGSVSGELSGTGAATIETPRGPATLHLELERGWVTAAHLETPAASLAALIPVVAGGTEVADALVGVASLDLSPWTLDQ